MNPRHRRVRWQDVERLEQRRLLTTYFVDNNAGDHGSNSNSGTSLSAPFLTIQQAATVAEPGDTVNIVGGTYREEVIPAHSGTAAAPITYQPYNNESVIVSGANIVSGWNAYSGSIYQSSAMTWTMGGQDDQVFVDGQMMNYARWPNTSLNVSNPNWELTGANTNATVSSNGTITNVVYDPNLTQPAGYWNGATIHIESGETWIYEAATITSYTRATVNGISYGVITYTSSYVGSDYYYAVPGDPYYITGDPYYTAGQFQNLDSAGEFYRDPNTGILYLWTPYSDSPASHVIEAKAREWAFDLSNLSYIDVNGLNLFAAGINSSGTSSHLLLNGITAQYVSQFENYTGNWTPTLLNGTSVIGGTGIVLDGGYDTLENSTIAYSAGEGVYLGGSNNTIYDNVIHDVDYAGLNCAAITTSETSPTLSSNDSISFNTLYNSGRTLIEASTITASQIDNNRLYNAMLQTTDGAAIYSFAGNGNGTEIDDNIIYNSENVVPGYSACGIFLDAASTGFTLDHNVIYDATEGIKFYQTYANNVINNTIANTDYSIELSSQTATGIVANNVTTSTIYLPFGTVGMTVSNNLQPPTDPLFVSESTGNYQLQSSSPAINTGIVVSPYTNGYLGSAPDLGAYEYGATPWSCGATNAAAIQPFDALPAPWTSGDIGSPTVTGSSTYSSGVFYVSGAGDDIWNSADQFQFVDTSVTGDQTIVARLTSQTDTDPWAKAGVMFRSTTAANSPFAMVVQTPGNGINFMWRDASGNLGYAQAAGVANPVWLKLARSGTTFTAYDSSDGVNWNTIDTITMPLAASGLMGLAVCSHNVSQICTVTFDNVSLQTQMQSPTGLAATSAATTTLSLSWNAAAGATGYQVQRSTDGVNFSTVASIGAAATYSDSGLSAGTEYYYRIIATGPSGSSGASSIVTATTLTLPPTGVTAVASVIQTTLSWNTATGAVSYNIYRGTTSGGEASTPVATGITALTYADTNVRTGVIYYYDVTAVNSNAAPLNAESARSSEVSVSAGVVTTVPATILAVNYDLGGQGVAYNSSSTINPGGVYRNDGIDIQTTTANGGGYYVGDVLPGEWLNYTISVPTTGYYSFSPLVASPYTGGTFHIDIDSANVSGPLTVPNTGSAQVYSTVTTGPVQMTAGRHVMQLDFDSAPGGQVGNFFSVAVAATAAPSPAVPTGLTATPGVGAVSLSWTAGVYDSTFNVYRSTTSGGEGTTPLATGITTSSYADTTATVGTKFYYTVAGVFATKVSAASNEASATSVVAAVLDGSFEQTSVNGSYVYDPATAYWKFTGNAGIEANGSALSAANAPDGTQAAFLQSLSQTSGGAISQTVAFASAGRFDFTFSAAQRISYGIEPIVVSVDGTVLTTITPGSTSFQNYSTAAINLSAGSHVLSFATSSTAPVNATSFIDLVGVTVLPNTPNPPSAVSATPGVGQITLSWTAPAGTVTYDIYRGTTPGGEGATPLATGITTTAYTDSTAVAGTTYYYVVTAVSAGLQSVNSTEVSATVTTVKITGTPIGTSTSYLNKGDTIAQVFDGNFNTYFDAPNSSLTNWAGLDMGSARTVTQIQYAPRAGFEFRMYGGQFQASNSANFSSGVVTLFTINTIPTAGKFTAVQVNPGAAYRYIRYIGGTQWVNIAEMEVDGLATTPQTPHQLTGTPIGTSTSYLNNGDTIAQVFDGNLNTYFDAPNNSLTNWVGLDLGSAKTITQIAYAPRAGYEFRMYGGQFQVSTTANFSSNVVTIYTITAIPVAGQLTTVNVSVPSQYRYIRYIGGTQWVNIAEMEVIGTS